MISRNFRRRSFLSNAAPPFRQTCMILRPMWPIFPPMYIESRMWKSQATRRITRYASGITIFSMNQMRVYLLPSVIQGRVVAAGQESLYAAPTKRMKISCPRQVNLRSHVRADLYRPVHSVHRGLVAGARQCHHRCPRGLSPPSHPCAM